MKAEVYTLKDGSKNGDVVELNQQVFDIAYDDGFMSMYFARMKKANYVPTNKTKNISEISGTTKKPYKQKHTGNARQGSTRSAQMRGGAIAFGPRGVKCFIKIPKGEATLAKAMLLSQLLREKKLFVIDEANFTSNKTKLAKKVLSNFADKNVVIINSGDTTANSLLAVRNIKGTKFVSSSMLTACDLFYANAVLIDIKAVNEYTKLFDIGYEESDN